jgi:hypothetical protein
LAKEQVTSVAMRRAVWWTFRDHCRRNRLPARQVLEAMVISFLSERGEEIMSEDELPPTVMVGRASMKM